MSRLYSARQNFSVPSLGANSEQQFPILRKAGAHALFIINRSFLPELILPFKPTTEVGLLRASNRNKKLFKFLCLSFVSLSLLLESRITEFYLCCCVMEWKGKSNYRLVFSRETFSRANILFAWGALNTYREIRITAPQKLLREAEAITLLTTTTVSNETMPKQAYENTLHYNTSSPRGMEIQSFVRHQSQSHRNLLWIDANFNSNPTRAQVEKKLICFQWWSFFIHKLLTGSGQTLVFDLFGSKAR